MGKIIYHSDDAGATPSITRRILDAWQCGLLDGFSIEANGESCADVTAAMGEHAARPCRVAVHLNVSEGPSAAPPEQVPLLVDVSPHVLKSMYGSLPLEPSQLTVLRVLNPELPPLDLIARDI